MNQSFHSILKITSLLFFLAVCIMAQEAHGQRKRNKGKSVQIESPSLSEEKNTELDHYFLEGEKYFILKKYQKALTFFSRVLEIDPTNAAANYKIAQIYFDSESYNEALPYALTSKTVENKNKFYHLQVAKIYTSLGDLDNAEKAYQDLVKNVSHTEEHLFDLAAIQLYQKKYDDAIVTYDLAEFHLGAMEEIYLQRQQIYLKQSQLDNAIEEGEKLIKLYPSDQAYKMNLARIMLSNDRLDQAEAFLERELTANPNNKDLQIMQAEVYRKKGQPEKACKALIGPFSSSEVDLNAKVRTLAGYLALLPNEKLNQPLLDLGKSLVEAHPDSYQALAMTGDLYNNIGDKTQAREMYLKAVKVDGSNFNLWQNILSLDLELQDYDGAINHTDEALAIFPNQATLYYFNGTAYLIKKDYENAIRAFNVGKAYAARDKNMNSLFHGQLGDAYNGMGDHKKSDAAYELALKAKPDNDHVLNNYSYFLSLRKKDLQKARTMSSKLVETYPENSTYLDTHAWVLYMMDDFEGAKKYLEEAIKYDPSSVIVEHYGDALFQLGQVDDAIIQWKKARDMADDTTTLDKKIADRQLYE